MTLRVKRPTAPLKTQVEQLKLDVAFTTHHKPFVDDESSGFGMPIWDNGPLGGREGFPDSWFVLTICAEHFKTYVVDEKLKVPFRIVHVWDVLIFSCYFKTLFES